MKNKLLALMIFLTCTGYNGTAFAKGNITAGKGKAESCAGCHGENGNSMVPAYPKLAEQHASYLTQQLKAFKNGSRENAMMESMVMSLSEQDIEDIAAFYASKKISPNNDIVIEEDDDDEVEAVDLETLATRGRDLYQNGDLSSEVSACIACHGPFGEGNKPAAFPALRSQHAQYLIKALTDFKGGIRSNNPDNMMHMIATKMTMDEIKAVSYYIATIE